MKYRIEFSIDDFRKGYCHKCPLADYTEDYYFCTLGYDYEDCPLEEVEDD